MKNRRTVRMFAAALMLSAVFFGGTAAAEDGDSQMKLGFCQAEKYYEFNYQLYYIADALIQDGILAGADLEGLIRESSTQEVWSRVCATQEASSSVLFVEDGYVDYSDPPCNTMDEAELSAAVKEHFASSDVDMVISMGTNAGLQVKESTDLPYMNFVSSDPVSSGIVENAEKSGDDRAWAQVSPGSDMMSLGVMNDIFAPRKLGIVYADNEDAYVYSGAENVDKYAEENGMTVEKRFVEDEFAEKKYSVYLENMRKAHEELAAQGIDVYILTTSMLNAEDFEYVLEPFAQNGIPTYSINSTQDVKNGAMAAVALLDYKNIGKFASENLRRLLGGEKLGDLPEVYSTAPYLVFNFDTVRDTKYRLPFQILASADEIYAEKPVLKQG